MLMREGLPCWHRLEGIGTGQLALDQVGQGKVFEHKVEEFVLGDLKDEFVHPLAAVAGLAATLTAATALWASDAVAAGELAVARVYLGLAAALAVMKDGLVDIAIGDADAFAVLDIGDRAPPDGVFDRLLDM